MKEIEIYKVVRNVRGSLYSAIVTKKYQTDGYYYKKYGDFWSLQHKRYGSFHPLLGFDKLKNAKEFLIYQTNYNINNMEIWKAIAIKSPMLLYRYWGRDGMYNNYWPDGTIFCEKIKLTDKVIQYH